MENNYESRFDSAARAVCDRLRNYLFLLPTDMKEQGPEIRPAGVHLLYGRRIFLESERTAFLPARAGRDAGNPRGHR